MLLAWIMVGALVIMAVSIWLGVIKEKRAQRRREQEAINAFDTMMLGIPKVSANSIIAGTITANHITAGTIKSHPEEK